MAGKMTSKPYFCAIDNDLAAELISKGERLLYKRNDITGKTLWVFRATGIVFDIKDKDNRGKGFYSQTVPMLF